MRTLAQKQNQPQEPVLISRAQSKAAIFDANHQTEPLPHLHSAINNRALESTPSTIAEEFVAGSSPAASRFAFDFSRIPVTPSLAPNSQFDLTRVPVTALPIQRTPAISSPSDAYEREADKVADQVMRMAEPSLINSTGEAINRKCTACEDEEKRRIQTKAAPAAQTDATLDAGAAVSAIKRGGTPLSSEVRSYFEPRFGYDFSRVRIHADAEAAYGARAVRARAYTIGRDIAFASGEYAPATMAGKRLLAHELTHVVQQGHSLQQQGPQISRQKTTPDDTSGKPRQPETKFKDVEQVKKDMCVGQKPDDAKGQCQFSSQQLNIVRIIKGSALRTCTQAISAVNMPGNEEQVIKIAKDYFNLNIKLSEKTRRALVKSIKAVSDQLEHSPIECGTCQDTRCNRGAIAHVDDARTFIVLCPQFFNSELHKVYLTPRFLIHEAGHLARLDQDAKLAEEFYCDQGATKEEKCPVVDPLHNVDAWSHFIEELAYTV